MTQNLHLFSNVIFAGAPLAQATGAVIFVHGRGDGGDGMLELARQVVKNPSLALVFPKATNATWYPASFLQPWQVNQPWLDSALDILRQTVTHLTAHGIPAETIFLLGFSQGACLSLDFAARNATRYGGIMALSGGLIGPFIDKSTYTGNFAGTPILLGCSDVDFHIPVQRVHDSESMVTELGAAVDKRIYAGMGHYINDDELAAVAAIIQG